MERHASLNTGLTSCAGVNLSHTGHAYSSVAWQSASVDVLMVAGFVFHFMAESFFITFFLAVVFALTFAM